VRVVRALNVIISPALRPLVQILAAFGIVISFWIILTGFFAGSRRDPDRVRYIYCTLQVRGLSAALKQYRADCGDYPHSQGLQSLVTDPGIMGWRGPYIKEVPLDPWTGPFCTCDLAIRHSPRFCRTEPMENPEANSLTATYQAGICNVPYSTAHSKFAHGG